MRRALRPFVLSLFVVAASCPNLVAGAESGAGPTPSAARPDLLVLGARTLFASNAETLSAAGEAALETLTDEFLERRVACGSIVEIRVVGHTDGLGPAPYNLALSERRARSVARVIARVIAPARPDVPLVVEGRGESAPVASDASADGRARNRRVEIYVISVDERC